MVERKTVTRERLTPIPNSNYAMGKYDDVKWGDLAKTKIPEGDLFVNIHYHEYRDKCDDDDDSPHYSGYWVVKSTYKELETDEEYFTRMKTLEKQKNENARKEHDLYLQLKAKYGD